jgi:CubicO group peptidase (beta-lactamase class C family)
VSATNLDREATVSPAWAGVCEAVTSGMAQHQVPGVAVGIWHGGREQVGGFGVTSVENPLPIDTETLYQIGSISKTFTATAVMRLVEAGRLDLDVPLQRYLPELRLAGAGVAERVTLRHTLTHTGGWVGDCFEDCGPGDDALARMVAHLANLPQQTPLGEVWSYNNVAFCLAGRAIEVVTGLTFQAAIQRLLLDPLGMSRTFYFPTDAITYRCSVGHAVTDDGPKVVRPWTLARSTHPFAGMISCVRDLLRWARFHLGDGTTPDGARLLSRQSLDAMQSVVTPAGSTADAVGITWLLNQVGPAQTVGHGGSWNQQMSTFQMVPAQAFAVIVLTNASTGSLLHGEVSAAALRHYLDAVPPAPSYVEWPAAELAAFAGKYRAALDTVELSVGTDGLTLAVTERVNLLGVQPQPSLPPPTRLAFRDPDRVLGVDAPFKGARGEFLRDPEGRVTWLRWGGRIHARQP